MSKKKKNNTFYYKDELNTEFSGIERSSIVIDNSYIYLHKNVFYTIGKFFIYRVIMKSIAWIYTKVKFRVHFVNGDLLKKYQGETCFVFGNHTNVPHDAFAPNALAYKKDISFLVSPENFAMPGTRTFMSMVGALPIPNKLSGMRHFMECLEYLCSRPSSAGRLIVVYPEAHIWPYYTGIRAFTDQSFQYPLKYDSKVFAMTTTYQQRKKSSKVNVTIYVDGPFCVSKNLSTKAARKKLRDQVYQAMVERSKNSTYEVNKFIQIEEEGAAND